MFFLSQRWSNYSILYLIFEYCAKKLILKALKSVRWVRYLQKKSSASLACRNYGWAQKVRDESPLRVIIRGASERGAILAQAILPRVETANLSDANVGVALKESCAVGFAIVCVENLAHLTAVAGRVVSGATSSGAWVPLRSGDAARTGGVVVPTNGAIGLALGKGTNNKQEEEG